MSGYFISLAKQSGVTIGGSKSSALAHESAPPPVSANSGAPPHVVTVDLIEPDLPGQSDVKAIHSQDAAELDRRPTPRNPISRESNAAAEIPTNTLMVMPSNQTERPLLDQAEPNSVPPSATRSALLEKPVETGPDITVSKVEVIGKQPKVTGGVVRVGAHLSLTDQKLLTEPDISSKTGRVIVRPESAILPDYMEGIREWLASPSLSSDDITSHPLASQQGDNDFPTQRQSDRSLHPHFEREVSSDNDIQEFSLSIGSISIVVEEPARQLPEQPIQLQPTERPPAGAQPRAGDAFALSRSYFRGF